MRSTGHFRPASRRGNVGRLTCGHYPEYVFLAAAKVGGVLANFDYPADFITENLQIQNM
jgi:GDP-L-fucose synthase